MKKNDGFTLIELLVTLVIVGVIMTFIISMMSSQYAIIRDVDAYLVMSAENKDVNDRIIQEFIKAEDLYAIPDGGTTYKSILKNSGNSGYFGAAGIPMKNVFLIYVESDGSKTAVRIHPHDTNTNELLMTRYTIPDGVYSNMDDSDFSLSESDLTSPDTGPPIGEHLANIDPVVTFYRRLSQDRRVVSLVKVKINYLHDGITKQYDLFYHLRNLQFN